MNPMILLAIGAVAVLALAGKKPGRREDKKDDTGTIPNRGDRPPPPAPTEQDAVDETDYVAVAVGAVTQPNWAPIYHLGQEGIDQAVLGVDADGFVTATPGEWLSGWLTRVAYWGAYQIKGWPLELPVTCVVELTCPEDMMPVRNALLRIKGLVDAKMAELGIEDVKL